MQDITSSVAYVLPRHYRFLFFIDKKTKKEVLFKLVQDNYRLWGGRYNPFIPVENNQIVQEYLELLPFFDPDTIYYSQQIDLEALKTQLPLFQPQAFVELKEDHGNNFKGVYSGYLIREEVRRQFFHKANTLVYFSHSIDHPIASFYQLSFGLSQPFIDDAQFNAGFTLIEFNNENINELNKQLNDQKTIKTCLLSARNAYATLFRPKNDWIANKFELIVYQTENPFEDIIYFWNRALFQQKDFQLKQLLVSIEQLELLKDDVYFELLLLNSDLQGALTLNSKSLPASRLTEICTQLNAHFKHLRLTPAQETQFPYSIINENFNHYLKENRVKHVLNQDKYYLPLPPPFAGLIYGGISGEYVCDLELLNEKDRFKYLRFPRYSSPYLLGANQPGRINAWHNVSFMVNERISGLDIQIPTGREIIYNRIRQMTEAGKTVDTPVGYPALSAAGKKLRAFIALFDEDLLNLEMYVTDSFWVRLFQGASLFKEELSISLKHTDPTGKIEKKYKKLPKSNIPANRDFFSRADLENELRRYYFHYRATIDKKFKHEGIDFTDDQFLDLLERSIPEDFDHHVFPTLQYLLEKNAVYLGMRVKCDHCGSNPWYPLKEVVNHMSCSGCHHTISPEVNSAIYYRFNKVITNNIRSDNSQNSNNLDGNYLLLLVLSGLAHNHQSGNGFQFAPCIDIQFKRGKETVTTDIDILAVQNGQLILGEAKIDSAYFNKKEVENLIWIGNNLRPDKILLAYLVGQPPLDKIEKIKNGLNDKTILVEPYHARGHWHQFGRIFGAGIEDEKPKNEKNPNIVQDIDSKI